MWSEGAGRISVKSQGELAEQDKMLLLMVSKWSKRCRRAMV